MAEPKDLGHGFSYRTFTERNAEGPTGIIIMGPAGPNCHHRGRQCSGGCHFETSKIAAKEGRPTWTVEQLDPLTLSPSIVCACGDQHGWIRGGRYEPC